MKEPLLVLPHIEKTAGSTLLRHIGKRYPSDKILRFRNRYGYVLKSVLDDARKKGPYTDIEMEESIVYEQDPSKYINDVLVVRGHFNADAFDAIHMPKTIAMVFREPLYRLISQYLNYLRGSGASSWRVYHDPGMTFAEYAFDPENINFQTKCLGAKKLDDIDVVGVTEELRDFMIILGLIEPDDEQEIVRLNASPHDSTQEFYANLTQDFVANFRRIHEQDYSLYYDVLNRIRV